MAKKVKLYRVNASEHFNLMSMYDHLLNMRDDARDQKDYDAEMAAQEAVNDIEYLLDKAPFVGSQVPWDILLRIRKIADKRRMMRYVNCLIAGASEDDAALAFSL